MSVSRRALGLILLFCACAFVGESQTAQPHQSVPEFTVEQSFVRKLGTTQPLRDYLKAQATSNEKLERSKAKKPSYVRNFVGRIPFEGKAEGAKPKGGDPLFGRLDSRDGGVQRDPEVNIEGIGINLAGAGVPDPNGDVGTQYYVQTVNATWIQVYDLLGNEVGDAFSANAIWSQIGQTSRGDPIIIYDQEVDRWFLTEFPPSSRVLIAVSETNDPFGAWTAYDFSTPSFPDYPKYGIWDSAYVLTTNEGGGQLAYYAINRHQILNGEEMVDMQRFTTSRPNTPGFIVATPVNWIGDSSVADGTKPMIMHLSDDGWGDPEDAIEVFEIDVDWADPGNTTVSQTTIPTSPFDTDICSVSGPGFSCIPQPSGTGIDGLPFVIMNKVEYRNFGTHSSIVLNFAVDVTGETDAGIRWAELRKTGDEPWSLYQEGTVGSDDGDNRFMGGISIDSKGNIGLAYSISSEERFPSLRYTGRFASDPLGVMSLNEVEFATGSGSWTTNRYGDYASMSVDDQDMFWYCGEYVDGDGSWSTKIVGYRIFRDQNDIGPLSIVSPTDSPDLDSETVVAEFKNYGLEPQTEFTVGYVFNNGDTIREDVTIDPLLTDSIYEHTFAEPIQFTIFGTYPLVVFTELASDENDLNDICEFELNKLARNDAEIFGIDGITEANCDTFIDGLIVLRNNGVDVLTSAEVSYEINGLAAVTMNWTGNLANGETEGIPVRFAGLSNGQNTIAASSALPNGVPDEEMSNDRVEIEVTVTQGGERVILELLTDLFPEETTWELRNSAGDIIFSDGPFSQSETLFTTEWCLESDSCYTFILKDSYSDGITGYGIDGDFRIITEEGFVLASLADPDFGAEDVSDFCVTVNCSLNAVANVAHESKPGASDGLVNIFASGGSAPYTFSNDGGFEFQASPIFANLEPGDYVFVVRDGAGCTLDLPRTVLSCGLQAMYDVSHATGPDQADGSIEVSVEGGNGTASFSIDDGDNYQDSPNFEGLLPGKYPVRVRDSVRCSVGDSVEVEFGSSVEFTTQGQIIRVHPNPSARDFYFEIEGLTGTSFLTFQILDMQGQVIATQEAGSFGGVIRGYFVLNDEPPGMYLLRFKDDRLDRLVRIIKQ